MAANNTTDSAEEDIMRSHSAGSGASSDDGDDGNEEAIKYVWIVGGSILIVVGTVGNLLALVVLTRPKLRRSNAAVYLMVVAVTDLAVLYTGLLRQIMFYSSGRDMRKESEASCKLHTTLLYFFMDFSSWLLAALSVERLFSVCWPHKVRQKCTRMTSVCVITGIGVTLFAINAHFLGTIGDRMYFATPRDEGIPVKCVPLSGDAYYIISSVWPWIDLSVFALLPLTIHIVCNFFIVRRVVSSIKASRRNRGFGPPTASRGHAGVGCVTTPRLNSSSARADRSWISHEGPSSCRRVHDVPNSPGFPQGEHEERLGGGTEGGPRSPGLDVSTLDEHHPCLGTTTVSVLTSHEPITRDNPDLAAKKTTQNPHSSATRTHSPATRRWKNDHRLHITTQAPAGHPRLSAIPSPTSPHDDNRVSSMTVMLITVSTVFCLTTLPISLYHIIKWALVEHGYIDDYQRKMAWPVLTILMYTNNSVNFILYSLSGSRFRAELKTLWHTLRKRLPRPVRFRRSSAMTTSSITSSRSGKSKSSVEIRRWSSNTEMSSVENQNGKGKKTCVPATITADLV